MFVQIWLEMKRTRPEPQEADRPAAPALGAAAFHTVAAHTLTFMAQRALAHFLGEDQVVEIAERSWL